MVSGTNKSVTYKVLEASGHYFVQVVDAAGVAATYTEQGARGGFHVDLSNLETREVASFSTMEDATTGAVALSNVAKNQAKAAAATLTHDEQRLAITNYLEAIKTVRARTGATLAECKDSVQRYRDSIGCTTTVVGRPVTPKVG